MFGWLKSRVQKKSVDAMRDDLERFARSLEGASSQEAADVLMMATLVRLQLEKSGQLQPSDLSLMSSNGSMEADLLPLKINRFISDLQKQGKKELAAGAMVWLHTARVVVNPELRLLGRAMWRELQRGLPAIDPSHIQDGIRLGHLPDDIENQLGFIPKGLEPIIS
tara:strand:- start:132 stop:629 length:498 start_codon:yes stop_codon:yes gene_type:complete